MAPRMRSPSERRWGTIHWSLLALPTTTLAQDALFMEPLHLVEWRREVGERVGLQALESGGAQATAGAEPLVEAEGPAPGDLKPGQLPPGEPVSHGDGDLAL